jgi:hypothetical protein
MQNDFNCKLTNYVPNSHDFRTSRFAFKAQNTVDEVKLYLIVARSQTAAK